MAVRHHTSTLNICAFDLIIPLLEIFPRDMYTNKYLPKYLYEVFASTKCGREDWISELWPLHLFPLPPKY